MTKAKAGAKKGGISTQKPTLPPAAPAKRNAPVVPEHHAGNIEYSEEQSKSILEKLLEAAEAAEGRERKGPKTKKRVFRNIIGEFMPAIEIMLKKNIPIKDIQPILAAQGLSISVPSLSKAIKRFQAAEALKAAKAAEALKAAKAAEEAKAAEGEHVESPAAPAAPAGAGGPAAEQI